MRHVADGLLRLGVGGTRERTVRALSKRVCAALPTRPASQDVLVADLSVVALEQLVNKYGKGSAEALAAKSATLALLQRALQRLDQHFDGDVTLQVGSSSSGALTVDSCTQRQSQCGAAVGRRGRFVRLGRAAHRQHTSMRCGAQVAVDVGVSSLNDALAWKSYRHARVLQGAAGRRPGPRCSLAVLA